MYTIFLEWSNFKVDVMDKGFPVNYKKTGTGYEVFVIDRTILWICPINDSTDISDFETNYKSNANRNTSYNGEGSSIEVPKSAEAQVFTDLGIRDTSAHNSVTVSNVGYRVKTIIIWNQLNQTVTLTFQASRDAANWFNVCDSFTVSAATLTYQTCEAYFPYNRCIAQCVSSPTTGTLNAWCEKMGV